jgi:hypothetical protein
MGRLELAGQIAFQEARFHGGVARTRSPAIAVPAGSSRTV